jgi:hypothetical protein
LFGVNTIGIIFSFAENKQVIEELMASAAIEIFKTQWMEIVLDDETYYCALMMRLIAPSASAIMEIFESAIMEIFETQLFAMGSVCRFPVVCDEFCVLCAN